MMPGRWPPSTMRSPKPPPILRNDTKTGLLHDILGFLRVMRERQRKAVSGLNQILFFRRL
jgi:hypothetical protein